MGSSFTPNAPGRLLSVQYVTSSQTVSQVPGAQYYELEVVGGGGNQGPGGTSAGTGNGGGGGGGGGGGRAKRRVTATQFGASQSVTIAGAQGTSSIGVLVSATGGNAGGTGLHGANQQLGVGAPGGAPGIGIGGDINSSGTGGGTGGSGPIPLSSQQSGGAGGNGGQGHHGYGAGAPGAGGAGNASFSGGAGPTGASSGVQTGLAIIRAYS